MQCETVKIAAPVSAENPLGYILINADELDGRELFAEPASEPDAAPKRAKGKE